MRTVLLFLCLGVAALMFPANVPAQTKPGAKPSRKAPPKQSAKAPIKAQPEPSPKLSPEQVVGIVMNALKNNDKKDNGIATTFRFASPQNRRFTGPLPRFIAMVKSPGYRSMLHFKSMTRGPIQVRGDQARQTVTITTSDGQKLSYLFGLSKQQAAPYKDCWMTDSVLALSGPPSPKSLPKLDL
jgi:hypothetical protein